MFKLVIVNNNVVLYSQYFMSKPDAFQMEKWYNYARQRYNKNVKVLVEIEDVKLYGRMA